MGFRCTQISLFLTALLQLTGAAAGLKAHHIVRVGDDVTLSCENAFQNQVACGYTSWVYSNSAKSAAVELVILGKINVAYAGAKSDRLNVTGDCSLLIRKVTEEDVGNYVCRQYIRGRRFPDAEVYLSPLTMTETKSGDGVTLRCSVRTYGECALGVKWLYSGKDANERHGSAATPHHFCFTDVTLKLAQPANRLRNISLYCEVTVDNKKQGFPFRLQTLRPGEDNSRDGSKGTPTTARISRIMAPTEGRIPAETTPASENKDASDVKECRWSSGLDFVMLALRVAEVLLITLIVVLLFRARGRWRPPDDANVGHDGEDGTETYENVGKPSASLRLH